MRFDPGAFYESVYQYVGFHIEKYGTVIPKKNLYLEDDEGLEVLKKCVEEAESRLPQSLPRKMVDRIWNRIKGAYGGKHRPPDAEIFDEAVLFENTSTGEEDSH